MKTRGVEVSTHDVLRQQGSNAMINTSTPLGPNDLNLGVSANNVCQV